MIENISAQDLIARIIQWRIKFMWITIVTAIVTGIVVFFVLSKQYKSTAIVFPARQFSVSKLVIEANAGNQEDYMMMGDADDCEKLMQILLTDNLKMRVADRYDLWKKWKIDTTMRYHFLKQKWDDQIVIKRTEFNSIKIEVYDYTASDAAKVANGIADFADTIRFHMNRELAGQVVDIVKKEYDNTLLRMKELEDSLFILRQKGVLHYKEQVKAYSKEYAKALSKNDKEAINRLQPTIDTLKKYGSAYMNIKDNLDKYGAKYPDIKMKYDEALVNYNAIIPLKFVVEKAIPNEFKARPKRMVLMAITVLAANLFGLFFLLLRERFRAKA